MRLGIFAKIFAGTDPAVVLAKVSSAGFSAAQYNLACSGLPSMPDAIPPSTAEAICSAASTLGVAIVASAWLLGVEVMTFLWVVLMVPAVIVSALANSGDV